jgi:hypothetical protein
LRAKPFHGLRQARRVPAQEMAFDRHERLLPSSS